MWPHGPGCGTGGAVKLGCKGQEQWQLPLREGNRMGAEREGSGDCAGCQRLSWPSLPHLPAITKEGLLEGTAGTPRQGQRTGHSGRWSRPLTTCHPIYRAHRPSPPRGAHCHQPRREPALPLPLLMGVPQQHRGNDPWSQLERGLAAERKVLDSERPRTKMPSSTAF